MRDDLQRPLSRRAFVATTCASATAAALVPLRPRRVDAALAPSSARDATAAAHDVAEVEERSVAEWQAALTRGELTSHDLVERYLQRIESLDRSGPMLHAVLETNPDALAIAASLDAERRAGKTRARSPAMRPSGCIDLEIFSIFPTFSIAARRNASVSTRTQLAAVHRTAFFGLLFH